MSIDLEDGETIWTESSYKYTVPQFITLLTGAGFWTRQRWIDGEGQFARFTALSS